VEEPLKVAIYLNSIRVPNPDTIGASSGLKDFGLSNG